MEKKDNTERTFKRQAEREARRARVLMILAGHIGSHNVIGMAELYEEVFGEPWHHRINDTRALRKIITDLRADGVPICSVADREGGGYYLAAAGSELRDYLKRSEIRALKILKRNAAIKRVSLPKYLGQLRLDLTAPPEVGDGEAV